MAGADSQTISGLYKTVFENVVAEQSNNKFTWNKLFRWEDVDYAGQEVVYNAHVSRNVSPMWVGEDSAFADAGAQGSIKIHIGQRKLMARVRLTSEAIHDSMKNEGAFRSARKDEMTRIIDDIARMKVYPSPPMAAACWRSSTTRPRWLHDDDRRCARRDHRRRLRQSVLPRRHVRRGGQPGDG